MHEVKTGDIVVELSWGSLSQAVVKTRTAKTMNLVLANGVSGGTKQRIENYKLYDENKCEHILRISKEIVLLKKEMTELYFSLESIC